MYKFIKIKVTGWTKGQWYFQPQSVQDINDFFDTVVRSEIQDGLHDDALSELRVFVNNMNITE